MQTRRETKEARKIIIQVLRRISKRIASKERSVTQLIKKEKYSGEAIYKKDGLREARNIIDLEISIWEADYGSR